MKAVAVFPGKPSSVHLAELPMPSVDEIPNGRGVLVKVLQIGVDATDREINEALYGNPPPGCEYLIIGHESFGEVVEVGPNVKDLKPGDLVTCTVRRPGVSRSRAPTACSRSPRSTTTCPSSICSACSERAARS